MAPQFPLEQPEIEHADPVSDYLEHHGVKGMKWGVRRDRGHEGQRATNKKIAKLDKKFEKKVGSTDTFLHINNTAAKQLNDVDFPRINAKPEYDKAAKQGLLNDVSNPVTKRYYKEIASAMQKRYNDAASSLGTNASGTRRYAVDIDPESLGWRARLEDVKHADEDVVYLDPVYTDGLVTAVKVRKTELEHTDLVGDYLQHYGVKGMKWGRRKAKLPSVDARRAQRLRTKSLDELTNKQLKELNNRDNMERQWRQAHPNGFTKGRNIATAALATAGLGVSAYNLVKSQAGQAAIKSGQELFKKLVK